MKLRSIRLIYQTVFLTVFLVLLTATSYFGMRNLPVRFFLELDPLLALSTVLAEANLYRWMILGLVTVTLTLLFGRVFCGWFCPLGTMNQLTGALLVSRKRRETFEANRWRSWFTLKYYILTALLVSTLMGINAVGILDPIALTVRSLSTGIFPSIGIMTEVVYISQPYYHGGWLISVLFLGILLMNLWIPRLWCRALCPLGALLGLLSRFPFFKITRNDDRCTGCKQCLIACQGADEPLGEHRVMECFVCVNCTEHCPEDALIYGFNPPLATSIPTRLSRRKLLTVSLFSWVIPFTVKGSSGGTRYPAPERIRPPGSLPEREFLDRCVRCGECMKVCPTNALHPSWNESGIEGVWTPVLIPRLGYCEYNCNLCSKVCPTGAIRRFSIEEKIHRPIVIGLAMFDRGRCLPWANQTPCTVCEEMCPTDPKAIVFDRILADVGEEKREILQPRLILDRCIGCGICENKCPVVAEPAIYVISTGETRDPSNTLIGARA